MNKLTKTAKTLDTIFKVLQVITVVGIVASLVGMAILGVGLLTGMDISSLGEVTQSLIFGNAELTLAPDAPFSWQNMLTQALIATAASFVGLTCAYVGVRCLRAIFAPMKEGNPFHDSVSKNLKKMGWVVVVLAVVQGIINMVESFVAMNMYPLQELFAGSYVTGIEITGVIDLSYLIVAGVCFLLSYIFSYGTQLQKLSDETL